MKKLALGLLVAISAMVSSVVSAGVLVTVPGPLSGSDITWFVQNTGSTDITSISFDLSGTQSMEAGNPPIVFGGLGSISGPAGGTAALTGIAPTLIFGFTFTSFNPGEIFSFNWDPDTFLNVDYGSIVMDGVGTTITYNDGGRISQDGGVMVINNSEDGLINRVNQVPEPSILALLGLGLAGLGFFRRRV